MGLDHELLTASALESLMSDPCEPLAASKPSNDVSVTPLTDAEASAVRELRERLMSEMPHWQAAAQREAEAHLDDFTLIRFVVARKPSLEDAFQMFKLTMHWRSADEYAIGKVFADHHPARPDSSSSTLEVARAHFYAGFGGFTRDGAPFLVERLGRADLDGITREGDVVLGVMIDAYCAYLETALRLVRAESFARGKLVKALIIVDAAGVGLSTLRNVSVIKKVASIGPQYYPEVTYKVLIVNAPLIASVVWTAVSVLMPSHTREKVNILSSGGTIKALLELVDEEVLPDFLGGRRQISETAIGGAQPIPVGLAAKLERAAAPREAKMGVQHPSAPEALHTHSYFK